MENFSSDPRESRQVDKEMKVKSSKSDFLHPRRFFCGLYGFFFANNQDVFDDKCLISVCISFLSPSTTLNRSIFIDESMIDSIDRYCNRAW